MLHIRPLTTTFEDRDAHKHEKLTLSSGGLGSATKGGQIQKISHKNGPIRWSSIFIMGIWELPEISTSNEGNSLWEASCNLNLKTGTRIAAIYRQSPNILQTSLPAHGWVLEKSQSSKHQCHCVRALQNLPSWG